MKEQYPARHPQTKWRGKIIAPPERELRSPQEVHCFSMTSAEQDQ